MMMMFGLSLMVPLVLTFIYANISWKVGSYDLEKNSPFECGFDPMSKMRAAFSVRFFVLVVLFLIFDIEISLLFPVLNMTFSFVSSQLGLSLAGFLVVLLFGLFYEWYQGALDWVSS
uniref:NADH-ubiquinone oxidoreductase chain 3 n=1 Tax=Ryssota otaheitana TaxID=2595071 RepID=A0A5B8G4L0_9EUPU|nr:NADH dehydrogenase subunit 3 [Ryssota otaheitana]QDM39462.1 NADH dehydrogenase subunit 3 [Ryssota otaheitana]